MADAQDEQASESTTSKLLRPFKAFLRELGLVTLYHSPIDTKILILQRFVRLFAYGGSTLILASYLSDLGNEDQQIGLFMTLTLVGDVFISFLLTLVADQLGRRWILVLGAALMCASGVVFGLSGNFWILLAAAILGVISPA
jgi:MFS family permease